MTEKSTERSQIIEVKRLTKVFDNDVKAVDGISFDVEKGEILGFLGPNGAGKTTTLNMLSTLLRPTSGTAIVNGYDILEDPDGVRRSIGFVFQDPTLDNELTGSENLDFHGRIYGLKRDVRQKRIKEILDVVQLTERASDFVKTYSGGMKRRLEIGRGLLHYPKVLFLDEPTLGLDPQTRRVIWEFIQRLNEEVKVTIILTTHYTEEADYLCDRIQIIDLGKIVALDTPDKLKARLEGDIVSLTFKDSGAIEKIRPLLNEKEWIRRIDAISGDINKAIDRTVQTIQGKSDIVSIAETMPQPSPQGIIPQISLGNAEVGKMPKHVPQDIAGDSGQRDHNDAPKRLDLLVDNGGHRIPEIVKLVDGTGAILESVELHKPTLDDVFLSVAGRNIRDERSSFMEEVRRRRIVRQARGQRVKG
jgi:ABC-2 type transport system ATP-binding protein